MFGIYGVNGPLFLGRLEEMPSVRSVMQRRPVEAIGSDGDELGDITAKPPPLNTAGAAAYRRMLHIDEERGPLRRAGELMHPGVITVRADAEVVRAWRILTSRHIHQAPVVDEHGALVGIVSERNLLTSLNLEDDQVRDALARHVTDVMTSPVVAADPQTDIRRIAQVMVEYGVDGVPIVNEQQRLVGIISRGDVLRAVVNDPPLSLWR